MPPSSFSETGGLTGLPDERCPEGGPKIEPATVGTAIKKSDSRWHLVWMWSIAGPLILTCSSVAGRFLRLVTDKHQLAAVLITASAGIILAVAGIIRNTRPVAILLFGAPGLDRGQGVRWHEVVVAAVALSVAELVLIGVAILVGSVFLDY